MEDKSIFIIEQSIKLFAKKGFSATSVQEIANECGISKGAFYLHFKSKDALLLDVFYHYSRQIQLKTDEIQAKDLNPREKFIKKLAVTFKEIIEHREFIIMQIREQAIPFNDDIERFLQHMRFNSYYFYKKNLMDIYGEDIKECVWEITLLLQGIFKAYIDLIIIENVKFDIENLCEGMLKRVDFLVEGFNRSNDRPVITEKIMSEIIPKDYYSKQADHIIDALKEKQPSSTKDIKDTIAVILEELKNSEPRIAVIKGMVTNLEEEHEFQQIVGQIRSFFQI
ncbi:TetR/AcrR family transcriptional regulator [Halobacillus shinanisalinarum]|uniref:TetR/AcrR family transcriptional regulator n=1 Tax=Halobacillus shinanisalinarum TaxID=2932258 RepID=A0ABY4H4G6_9BACI|nr:TetR/AcrR family transcriptional regulator [Halobacillus shinanisalinarum]UOQ95209.1 TetR/AcrR family transcriptional regulator [Halobacillus shinanisalinarum]